MKIIKGPDGNTFGLVVSKNELSTIFAAWGSTNEPTRANMFRKYPFLGRDAGTRSYIELRELMEEIFNDKA